MVQCLIVTSRVGVLMENIDLLISTKVELLTSKLIEPFSDEDIMIAFSFGLKMFRKWQLWITILDDDLNPSLNLRRASVPLKSSKCNDIKNTFTNTLVVISNGVTIFI